jgi:DNA-binding NarL/FixJ family response regulator
VNLVLRQLRKKQACAESKLILLTMHATPTYATEAFKTVASGYLIKRSAAVELKQAIQAVM